MGSAHDALDTLGELAAAFSPDANYVATENSAGTAGRQQHPMLREQARTGIDLLNCQSKLWQLMAEDELLARVFLDLANTSSPKNKQVVMSGAAHKVTRG